MPELPEVETIRRGLEKHLVGLTLIHIHIHLPKVFFGMSENVIGGVVETVRRFGKGLVIDLSNSYSIAVHVKMTGQLIYQGIKLQSIQDTSTESEIPQSKQSALPNKYTHVIFSFKNEKGEETRLFFNDIRQFGWVRVVETNKLLETSFFKNLGKEPLRDLTVEDFTYILATSKAPIKQVLMDQQKIAGIGNIYANDALWDAKIHPLRTANSLSRKESSLLFASINKVLTLSINVGGASERDYVNVLGEKGGYQYHFLVYKQTGKPCKRCGKAIERIVIGGRGTFICSGCQSLSR